MEMHMKYRLWVCLHLFDACSYSFKYCFSKVTEKELNPSEVFCTDSKYLEKYNTDSY